MRALHLFAGAGGSVLAGHLLGWESVGCVEIDEFCCAVLEARGERVIGRDVTTFDGRQYAGSVDVVVGGSPCQDLSLAGKRAGLAGERSGLWFHQLRIAVECQAPFIFWENVRGAFSSNGGRDFGAILGSLADAGYDARWGMFRASDVGAPHRRERVFLVAYNADAGLQAWGGNGIRIEPQQGNGPATCGGNQINVANSNSEHGTERTNREQEQQAQGGTGIPRCSGGRIQPANTERAQRTGDRSTNGTDTSRSVLDNARDVGHAGREPAKGDAIQEPNDHHQASGSDDAREEPTTPVSGLGGGLDGLASWMDAPARWPAGKGQAQHDWEPPRLSSKTEHRLRRLKALGNGWVPQCGALAWRVLTS